MSSVPAEVDPQSDPENPASTPRLVGSEAPKRRRNARACDRCHRGGSKCSPGVEGTTCVRCEAQRALCTYNRPAKRRGPRSHRVHQVARTQLSTTLDESTDRSDASTSALPIATDRQDWPVTDTTQLYSTSDLYSTYESIITPEVIDSLVEVYYHANYPIRPYFHWPTYHAQIRLQLYRSDWGLFIVTMAVCSLAAARLCDGVPTSLDAHPLCSEARSLSSTCYAAATAAMPNDITDSVDYFQMMKAQAILASTCFQKGDLKRAIAHHGNYGSLSVCSGFHDEANWPAQLTEIEKEERRRLFWGTYQSEQWTCNSFNLVPRQREGRADVRYPAEVVDDDDITETNIRITSERVSFLQGWNFCTDLYRLLENIDHATKTKKTPPSGGSQSRVASLLAQHNASERLASTSLYLITDLYQSLPQELKKVRPLTGDPRLDRYGYIASNILVTTQILKLVLLETEESSIHQRCAIAGELLDELSTVPVEFLHTINTVSLQHLAHVGHLLGSVIKSPLSTWKYLQVRNILLVFADLLNKIESSRGSNPTLAPQLQVQIDRIDQYMQEQSQQGRTFLIGQNLLSKWPNPRPSALTVNADSDRMGQQPSQYSADVQPSNCLLSDLPGRSRSTQQLDNDDFFSFDPVLNLSEITSTHLDAPPHAQDSLLGTSYDVAMEAGPQTRAQDPGASLEQDISLPSEIVDNWESFLGRSDAFVSLHEFS